MYAFCFLYLYSDRLILVFRQIHGLISIAGIFVILAAGPRSCKYGACHTGIFINFLCIMLLMIFSCHNVIMYNHSTFVLSYLLLLGYDVSGHDYLMRIAGFVSRHAYMHDCFYKIRKTDLTIVLFKNLFFKFNITSSRTKWYIKLTFIVSRSNTCNVTAQPPSRAL